MTDASPLLALRNITRVYGRGAAELRALDGVDLTVNKGEFVAVMGPSGSGKSTAMNIIGCLDKPTSGEYLFEGLHVERFNRDQRTRLRRHAIGFVFQGFNLLARTSAQENVELPLVYRNLPARERSARARRSLAAVGLAGWEHHTPAELSGGQQQRVAIARAIVTEPMLLVADEPTGNLDSVKSREVMDLLVTLNVESDITIVMVTHDANVAAYAQHVVRFLDGRIAGVEVNPARPRAQAAA